MSDKHEALMRLQEIFQEVQSLGEEAEDIQRRVFPHDTGWCEAYQVFRFGTSGNPYDQTFEKFLENLERQDEEDNLDWR